MAYAAATQDTIHDDIDLDALRQKYMEERAKRLNPKGNSQYIEVKGDFSRYIDDPYVDGPLVRDAVDETVEALVIGGGFGGLLAAAELHKIGVTDIRIVEKAGDFGGTWYWNRYPGAQCDIESYIYMPLLEETGYVPTEKYAYAAELFAHARRIGEHYDLYPRALFQTQIVEIRWDEAAARWVATTDRGDTIRARWVLSASGPLNRPKLPGIPGIEDFKGHTFHTSRWDYAYTGGNSLGGMTGLADKRVAIIGTGATAIQCVPPTARDAAHLYVVQRTPSTVDVRGNRPTDPEWVKNLKPGWQRERMDNFNVLVSGMRAPVDLVQDGWTALHHDLLTSWMPEDPTSVSPLELMRRAELADFRKGNKVRSRIDEIVTNKDAAEGLKPWYGMLCKRPTFHDTYLQTFNQPNVTLIDTQGGGLDRITENGIVFDGVEYPVDCIIFATGFETGTDYSRRAAMAIRGRDGKLMSDHFADGMRTFHGFFTDGFPNLFLLGSAQNGFKPNVTDMLAEQAEHLAGLIAAARAEGKTRIEATSEAVDGWMKTIREKSQRARMFLAACTPGYFGGHGDIEQGLLINTYGDGSIAFTALLQAWRAAGDHAGLKIY
ncbi:flavin-containing monooxygenase [Sphingobium chlorophenolicum]|uniref:Phenylacetone monooxygenase n=1 Tax=Sphingobium chlorophenolicum TaxID=46429 RepID=A0A081RB29_SPHCR|nr:NAD(P)/FAD-dependent oxidoreductase [Sphingobium chlorophenolicum]KEQ52402.1 Phenylacetone monooxygenase [Sphingobium chlorophenolicum]